MILNRWKASAIHLLLSMIIASMVLAIMLLVWYPEPYFHAFEGRKLLFLILKVDVVLGPLVTLVVYVPKKKGLKFDLAVIAVLQASALVYGVSVLFQARPVYLVLSKDRFDIVAAHEIEDQELNQVTREEFQSLPITGPRLVGVVMPESPQEQDRIFSSALATGLDLPSFPQYYVSYQERMGTVLSKAKPLAQLYLNRPQLADEIKALEQRLGQSQQQLAFLPIVSQRLDLTAIIARASGELLEILPIDPWDAPLSVSNN